MRTIGERKDVLNLGGPIGAIDHMVRRSTVPDHVSRIHVSGDIYAAAKKQLLDEGVFTNNIEHGRLLVLPSFGQAGLSCRFY